MLLYQGPASAQLRCVRWASKPKQAVRYDGENDGSDNLLTWFHLTCQLECLQRHDWVNETSLTDIEGFEVISVPSHGAQYHDQQGAAS